MRLPSPPQASLLEYAKGLGEAAADGSPVTDAVLAVPASYTPQQVRACRGGGRLQVQVEPGASGQTLGWKF